jgi:hypothetical protein
MPSRTLMEGGGTVAQPPRRRPLTDLDQLRLRSSADAGVCPACGAALPDAAIGTGARADGLYCSLECLTRTLYVAADERSEEERP